MKRINKNYSWVFVSCILIVLIILLLIVAIRQIVSNFNLEKYHNSLHVSVNALDKTQNDHIYENIMLNSKTNELQKEVDVLKRKLAESEEANKIERRKQSYVIGIYEALIKSELLSQQGNLLSAAEAMRKEVNKDYLLNNGSELERKVRNDVFYSAALNYYNEGLLKYSEDKYSDAIDAFKKSIYFQRDEYFDDDTLYLLGYCYYKTNNFENAFKTFEDLCSKYPESIYISEAREFIKALK